MTVLVFNCRWLPKLLCELHSVSARVSFFLFSCFVSLIWFYIFLFILSLFLFSKLFKINQNKTKTFFLNFSFIVILSCCMCLCAKSLFLTFSFVYKFYCPCFWLRWEKCVYPTHRKDIIHVEFIVCHLWVYYGNLGHGHGSVVRLELLWTNWPNQRLTVLLQVFLFEKSWATLQTLP